mmetsp:Transcript_20290/g.56355  ORF Transcript_20290/g.56355 Transcript_20290/m.56355 type:complete len:227 (-) Transcript_20290:334-1014(-)
MPHNLHWLSNDDGLRRSFHTYCTSVEQRHDLSVLLRAGKTRTPTPQATVLTERAEAIVGQTEELAEGLDVTESTIAVVNPTDPAAQGRVAAWHATRSNMLSEDVAQDACTKQPARTRGPVQVFEHSVEPACAIPQVRQGARMAPDEAATSPDVAPPVAHVMHPFAPHVFRRDRPHRDELIGGGLDVTLPIASQYDQLHDSGEHKEDEPKNQVDDPNVRVDPCALGL